jgi:transposase InsO family protein
MIDQGLSERRSLTVVGMSASAYRYIPRPDRNVDLRQRIMALAQRHKRYGVGMIHLKLRQAGEPVNYKRVERLYQEAKLQVRRRKRKKVPAAERQPLGRPKAANEVWSMDFVFDRTAEGRVIKCLTVVDDATHEAVVIEVERAISGTGVTRVMDRLALSRGLPKVIRSDNGKEFCGKAMVTWAHERGVQLRLTEPGKPTRTPTSNRSTVVCATSASTSTGFPVCCMRALKSNDGDANTTRRDQRKPWAG